MWGLKTFRMLGRVVTLLQVSRPPMANDTPRYWFLVWNRLGASAPEIVGYFYTLSSLESPNNLWIRWRCLREPPRCQHQPGVICWHWNRPTVVIFATTTMKKGHRHRGAPSVLLTLLALLHLLLDICRENLNTSVCIDFWSRRWPKFCIWNVPRTCSEISPPGGGSVRGGGRLFCSSLFLSDQVTSPPPPPPAPSIGHHSPPSTAQKEEDGRL